MFKRTTIGAVAASVGLVGAVAATTPSASAATLPVVDMARVLAAAQVEPACGQTAGLSDNASTILVQKALTARDTARPQTAGTAPAPRPAT